MLQSKPIRTVLRWQALTTLVIAALAGVWSGWHGAASALLGGLINFLAGIAYALLIGFGNSGSAGMALRTTFRAEAGKITLIVLQLWLVLTMYKDIVPVAFFSAFVATVVVFSLALFVRD